MLWFVMSFCLTSTVYQYRLLFHIISILWDILVPTGTDTCTAVSFSSFEYSFSA